MMLSSYLRRDCMIWITRNIFACCGLSLLALCGACSSAEMWHTEAGSMLVTKAEYRAINQTSVDNSSVHGRVRPRYITCAEPSPDVATAVSTALNVSGSGGVTLPNGVTPEVAAAVSRAHAEAVVQLGERLATVQLLRDGLHSACEAYANGAITDTTYAVMLSRFDKTMVTMLVSEIAGGAFGRSLAGAGAGGTGQSDAAADLTSKVAKTQELEQKMDDAQKQQQEAEDAAKKAEAAGDASQKQKQVDLQKAKNNVVNSQRELQNHLKATAQSAANVSQLASAGSIAAHNNPEIAKTLADIQRKYIENINFDALEVACISALDREFSDQESRNHAQAASPTQAAENGSTKLADYCMKGLLPVIQAKKGELLNAIVLRAEKARDSEDKRAQIRNDMKTSIQDIQDYVTATNTFLEQVKSLNGNMK